MKAFHENIDALEKRVAHLIQKWRHVREQNSALIEQNKQLEKELEVNKSELDAGIEKPEQSQGPIISSDLSHIQKALDQQILRIDSCIELINKELNGKG
jgi:predicted  nucleic acid-binding Zn-ribbon protein